MAIYVPSVPYYLYEETDNCRSVCDKMLMITLMMLVENVENKKPRQLSNKDMTIELLCLHSARKNV